MIYRYLIAALSLCVVCLFAWPALESDDYTFSHEQEFNTPPQDIFKYCVDIKNIPQRLPKISSVQIIDSSSTNQKFKLFTHNDQWMEMTSEITTDSTRKLHILSSSFGYSGVWQYLIRDLGNDQSKILIEEKSTIKNYWFKLLLLIAGRDVIVSEEIRGIQFMAKEDQ